MKNTRGQQGFTSIIVCLLIMIMLSLITIGFAQIMGREQREALDRQLSTQAFYAAESGVNDAALELATNIAYTKLTDCDPVEVGGTDVDPEIDPVGPIRSTCVTVDPYPPELIYNPISTNQNNPVVVPMKGVDPAGTEVAIARIEIQWTQAVGNTGPDQFRSNAQTWPAQSAWTSRTGVIKASIVPFSSGDGRAQLLDKLSVMYLNPTTAGGSIAYNAADGNDIGQIVGGNCVAASGNCLVSITGIPGYTNLRLVLSSIYRSNNVTVRAYSSANVQLNLAGAQAAIDSTGRSGDVLRRINVRKPLNAIFDGSNGVALMASGDICKLITANPVNTSNSACGVAGNASGL